MQRPPHPTLFPYTTLFRSHIVPYIVNQREYFTGGDVLLEDGDTIEILTVDPNPRGPRSEEHTSELQSHSELVCRLLLEKKKIVATDPTFANLMLEATRQAR